MISSGLSPRELDEIAESDPALFSAIAEGVGTKWGTVEELLAALYELTHANYRVLLSLAGAKRSDIPKPVEVPRPEAWQNKKASAKKKKAKSEPRATSSEFASWITSRRT